MWLNITKTCPNIPKICIALFVYKQHLQLPKSPVSSIIASVPESAFLGFFFFVLLNKFCRAVF